MAQNDLDGVAYVYREVNSGWTAVAKFYAVKQHGGSVAEAAPFVEQLTTAYQRALPAHQAAEPLSTRARCASPAMGGSPA